jgi:osmotically-inducible protein OsmY
VVNEAEPPHEKIVVDGQKLVVDTHHAAKVEPVPIAAVPGSSVADQRDRDYANRTPAERRTNASDAEITQRIRKAVVDDDNLTATAKNVQIATEDGRVTLRGNVRDAREKVTVESHARDVAGAGNVKNQIDVVN